MSKPRHGSRQRGDAGERRFRAQLVESAADPRAMALLERVAAGELAARTAWRRYEHLTQTTGTEDPIP